jgi:hypothetical protein
LRPIPSFNPANSPAGGSINLGAADAGARILLYNESFYNIKIDFLNGNQDILHAWEARWWPLDGDTKEVDWTIDSTLTVLSAPISLVMGSLYDANEELPGTYPISLIRQTNIGNATPLSSSTTAIVNTGNAPGQSIISAQPSDAASATWSADNSGNLTVKGDNAGTLTTLLQLIAGASPALKLAAAAILTEVLGPLQADSNIILPNAISLQAKDAGGTARNLLEVDASNNANLLAVTVGGVVQIVDASGAVIAAFVDANTAQSVDGANSSMSVGKVFFSIGSIKAISTGTITTSGSVTVNHGLSGTPQAVWCDCDTSGSTATTSTSAYTSTQFTLLNGSGVSLTFRWIAFR